MRSYAAIVVATLGACGDDSGATPIDGRTGDDATSRDAPTSDGPGGAGYPNQPSGFTHTVEIDLSQTPPTSGADVAIAGATGWNAIYMSGGWTAQTDPSAPQSPPGIWRVTFPEGSHGAPDAGWGVGNLYTTALGAGVTHLYVSLWIRFDPSYLLHGISNKFVNLESYGANEYENILVQINEGGNWFHFEELANAGSYFADPIVNTAPSFGAWHQLEIDLDIAGGRARIWLDGVLRTDGSTDFVAERTVGFGIYAFRGGGGECASCAVPALARDVYYDLDHIYLAWP